MFKHSPNGKGMVCGPNGYGIMASIEYTLIIYSTNGKDMFLWNIVFPSGNRHRKRLKRCTIKDTMSIKVNFILYRNCITWTRVKLPVVFEDFDMVYVFWLFLLSLSIGKRSINFSKIWGGFSGFYAPEQVYDGLTDQFQKYQIA